MTNEQSPAPQAGNPPRPDRKVTARVCAIACAATLLLLSAILVYAHAGVGCYMGLILMAASVVVLGSTALVLLAISAWLRLAELIWLGIACLLIAFATGLAIQLLPAVVCGYPG